MLTLGFVSFLHRTEAWAQAPQPQAPPPWVDAAAQAEQARKTAETLKTTESFKQCGDAFEALLDRHPPDKQKETAIYNAGVCYEWAKEVEKAIGYFRRISTATPRQGLQNNARLKAAQLNRKLGQISEAAKDYALVIEGPEAIDARQNALLLLHSLGKQKSFDKLLSQTLRSTQFSSQFKADMSRWRVTQIAARTSDAKLIKAIDSYLSRWQRFTDKHELVALHVLKGKAHLRRSCPRPLVAGLCVKDVRPAKSKRQCKAPRGVSIIRRKPKQLRAGKKHLRIAIKLSKRTSRDAGAAEQSRLWRERARFAMAALEFEKQLRVSVPSDILAASPPSPKSRQKLMTYIRGLHKNLSKQQKALTEFRRIPAAPKHFRLGLLHEQTSSSLVALDIPSIARKNSKIKAIYCSTLLETLAPIEKRANQHYTQCISPRDKMEHSVRSNCEKRWRDLSPATFTPALEIMPRPSKNLSRLVTQYDILTYAPSE